MIKIYLHDATIFKKHYAGNEIFITSKRKRFCIVSSWRHFLMPKTSGISKIRPPIFKPAYVRGRTILEKI